MIHIHTRWVGVAGDTRGDIFDRFDTILREVRPWGRMSQMYATDAVDASALPWYRVPAIDAVHRIVLYELLAMIADGTIVTLLGVASPFAAETASVLEELIGALREREVEVTNLQMTLSTAALGNLKRVRINSVRVEMDDRQRIEVFREPIGVSSLNNVPAFDTDAPVSGATLFIDADADEPVVVNLFADNQFYVSAADPEAVGIVAGRLASLLRPSDADLQR